MDGYKHRPNSTLKPDKVKRYYYHVTKAGWGSPIILTPIGGNSGNRAHFEPENERTCVAPSVAHCFSAITYYSPSYYDIFRTKDKVVAYWPYGVEDAVVTRERWIITDQIFVKVGHLYIQDLVTSGELDEKFSTNSECGTEEYLDHQREILKVWQALIKKTEYKGLQRCK
jgi:hypothetical protein